MFVIPNEVEESLIFLYSDAVEWVIRRDVSTSLDMTAAVLPLKCGEEQMFVGQ